MWPDRKKQKARRKTGKPKNAECSPRADAVADGQEVVAIMGLLQLFLSWVSRLVILLSVMLFSLMFVAKEGNIPLSRAFLRIAHLLSFR